MFIISLCFSSIRCLRYSTLTYYRSSHLLPVSLSFGPYRNRTSREPNPEGQAYSDVAASKRVIIIIIIIIMNFYSPVSKTRCHSIGHKMRIARIKIRVDSPGRWERA